MIRYLTFISSRKNNRLNRIQEILHQVNSIVQTYVDKLLKAVAVNAGSEFVQLNLVQHLSRIFVNTLTAIASLYEFLRYLKSFV